MPSTWEHASLSPRQRVRLGELYPEAVLVTDHSWPFGITVLEFHAGQAHLLLKASGTPHHLEPEYRAHARWLGPLTGDVPTLVAYDRAAGLLVKTFLPGRLVLGSPAERDPGVFRRAGTLLGRLHRGLAPVRAPHYQESMVRKTRSWLGRAEGLAPAEQLQTAGHWLEEFRPSPVDLVPTHGDYQPRNWLLRPDGRLAVIDFGGAELRPWYADFARMEHGDFAARPALQVAFMEGYGPAPPRDDGPAEDAGRRLDVLMQSLGTIVWSHDMGDAAFEEHGRTMLTRTLSGR